MNRFATTLMQLVRNRRSLQLGDFLRRRRNAARDFERAAQQIGLWIRIVFQSGATARIGLAGQQKLIEACRTAIRVSALE